MEERREIIQQRLEAFQFDEEGAIDRFCTRLARENGWTSEHAARVLEEYRRFVLLAVTAPHSLTPSDAVDQVWHLHLTYSDSYWNHFCPEVLGRPLHHHPSHGGAVARQRYSADYARTLETYSRVFGAPAPPDIWPDPTLRFGRDLRWQRVNLLNDWVLPRRPVKVAAMVSAALLGMAGLHALSRGTALGLLLAACAGASVLVAWAARPRWEARDDTASRSPPSAGDGSASEVAALSAGAAGATSGDTGSQAENGAVGSADGGDAGDFGGCGGGGCGGCGGGCGD